MSDPRSLDERSDDPTPSMFQRAADVHDLLPPVREADDVVKLHREWIRISMPPAGQSSALWPRFVRLVRRITRRAPGAVDREMIADLIRAIDARGRPLRRDCRPSRPSEHRRQRRRHHFRGGADTPAGRIASRAKRRRTALTIRGGLRPPMSEPGADRATLFLSRAWKRSGSELSFVTRSLAGAVSRTSPVSVLVPSAAGPTEPDGAFDLIGAGDGLPGLVAGCR